MRDATDCQLLERFVAERDEAAFAVLARRHAAHVLGVCRRVLPDEGAAEEVLQATFLVLARKAPHIPWQASVGGWLSAVAHRLACNARAAACRRSRHERSAGTLLDEDREPTTEDDGPLSAAARQELRAVVREEVERLPERYRAPVVLCYLEGKTNEQAARELGWPSGSMSRRLNRARQLLKERLTSRGVALLLALAALLLAPLALNQRAVRREAVARTMARLHAVGGEDLLRRAAAGEDVAPEQLLVFAEESSDVAEALHDHPPLVRRTAWRAHADEMSVAAGQLAETARRGDRTTTLLAVHRLQASCGHCHAVFRD